MRKSIIFALGLMLGVCGMTGCSKDAANEQINGGVEEFTLISHADAPDTRMVIHGDKANGFKTAWEDGDQIGVYVMPASTTGADANYFTCNQAHTGTVANGIATFVGTIYSTNNADFNLFAYYPYTKGSTYKDTDYQTGVKCSLATVQTMNGNSFDKSCSYMVAKTGKTINTSAFDKSAETADWQFRHTVAFINLGIKKDIANSTVSGDEIVKSATMHVADKTLAGDFQFNLENGEMTFTSSKDMIVVNVPADTKLSDLSAWFVTNPFELTADNELEIVITTKTHIITKKVAIAKSFKAANVYTLNLTIDDKCTVADAPQEPEVVVKWKRVTSLSEITAGEYVIASLNDSSYGYLPNKTTTTAPNCAKISSVSEDDTELTATTDDMIWSFSGTTSAMTIKNGTNYLSAGTSNNSVRVNTTSTSWAITTGKTGFNFKSGGGRYLSVYNGQDWRCYTNNTTNNCNIILFKKSTITTGPSIGVSDITNVSARGVEKEIAEYTTVNFADNTDDVTASVGANSDFITLGDVEAGMLEYTIAANYSDTQRTGTIVLTSAKNNVSATITVTQNAAVFTASRTEFALDAKKGKNTSITITSDFDWTISGIAADAKFEVTPQEFEYTNDTKQVINITASADNKSADEVNLGTFKVVRVADDKEIVLTVNQSANLLDNPTISYLAMQTTTLKAEWNVVANADGYTWHLYKGEEMIDDNIVGMGNVTTNSLNITLPDGEHISEDVFEAGVNYSLWIQSVASDDSEYVTPDTWSAPKTTQISTEKKITINATALSVLATGVSNATFDVKLDNLVASDVTVTCDGEIVSAAKWNEAGTQVVYTVAANSGAAREGSITLTADGVTPIVITVSQFAYSAPATYTLTFPDGNSKKVQNYTSTWSATIDNNTWSINNFNNNNSGWSYIRCGSKSAASTASIATDWAIEEAITKVTVTIDSITAASVNSIKLQVASDKNFNTVIGTYNIDRSTGDKVCTITTPTANCYYKLVFDCKKSSNGVVQVSKVVYTNKE